MAFSFNTKPIKVSYNCEVLSSKQAPSVRILIREGPRFFLEMSDLNELFIKLAVVGWGRKSINHNFSMANWPQSDGVPSIPTRLRVRLKKKFISFIREGPAVDPLPHAGSRNNYYAHNLKIPTLENYRERGIQKRSPCLDIVLQKYPFSFPHTMNIKRGLVFHTEVSSLTAYKTEK